MTSDLRIKVAAVAVFATVSLLSIISALGYVAMVDAARQSQLDLLNERLDQLESRLDDGNQLLRSLQLDLSLQVIRVGEPVPDTQPGILQVVRPSDDPAIEALVGRVSTREIDQTLATVRTALWISVLFVGLAVGVAAWVVVDRALAPVRRLTTQARTVEANQSLDLLPEPASGDEIAELASTFNSMLRKLRTADSERRRFVSDASHELRTPLMVLSADAEYALDHEPTSSTELAESVLTQSRRLTELVDNLLTLASFDEGRQPSNRPVPMSELLERAGATDVVAIDSTLFDVPVPDVSGAVANVVANARRHAKAVVAVSVERRNGSIVITVDDDGPGVPPDERAQIFRRFYRSDGARSRQDGGAGLGLAIAGAEIKRIGGTITVGDAPRGGARFTIAVPIDDGPDTREDRRRRS